VFSVISVIFPQTGQFFNLTDLLLSATSSLPCILRLLTQHWNLYLMVPFHKFACRNIHKYRRHFNPDSQN
jgi:hypothetical protein